MVKIIITVRNRLAITKKCIEALRRHSNLEHHIYVYNSRTNYLLDEHAEYLHKMYTDGIIKQYTFLSKSSVFNAFDKAVSCNMWGLQHEIDPNKDKYDFLLMLDNDIIVTPKYDLMLKKCWEFVTKNNHKNIKVIGQSPGGIKSKQEIGRVEGVIFREGFLGGSGLWSVRPNFFRDVGFLNIKQLVGLSKKHDQLYWRKLGEATQGKPYIGAISAKLGIHCGKHVGSVCNVLTKQARHPRVMDNIKFKDAEEKIESMTFDEFYNMIINDKKLMKDW